MFEPRSENGKQGAYFHGHTSPGQGQESREGPERGSVERLQSLCHFPTEVVELVSVICRCFTYTDDSLASAWLIV